MTKNLVISTVSDTSLHKSWVQSEGYDTYLIYYGDKIGYEGESTHYKKAKGYKYHLIKDAIEEMPNLWEYDYFWLPDDDIAASPIEINKIFSYMENYKLWLAQPSIMGYYGVDVTLHQKGSKIRFTNWVEIMCPCFSLNAILKCKDVFKENNCGWAIEGIWNRLLGHPKDKIAIIDDVIVFHTRPVLSGDTYTGKENPFKFAKTEADKIYRKWNLSEDVKVCQKNGNLIKSEVHGMVIYKQEFKEMEANIPKNERFWPSNTLFENFIKTTRK